MPKEKGVWHDSVWSKVIAHILIVSGATVVAYFLQWWPIIGRAVLQIWHFLGDKTPVWNWLLIVATIWVILTFIEARLASELAKKRAAPSPYTSDEFFGVRWNWRYARGEIIGLHSLCLGCGLQVYFGGTGYFDAVPRVQSKCDDCGRVAGPFDGTYEMLEDRVTRLIHRNLKEGNVTT